MRALRVFGIAVTLSGCSLGGHAPGKGAPAALAGTTRDPSAAVARTTLRARDTCAPPIATDDVRTADPPIAMVVPAAGEVADGLCAYRETDRTAVLIYCTTLEAYGSHGGAAQPLRCSDDPGVLAATLMPHGGVVERVSQRSLHLEPSNVCEPASIAIAIAALPDSDGDGVPDCAAAPDATAPSWPAGSTLSATAAGPGAATLTWTAASDDVAVAGYRRYQDGQPIGEAAPSTWSACWPTWSYLLTWRSRSTLRSSARGAPPGPGRCR